MGGPSHTSVEATPFSEPPREPDTATILVVAFDDAFAETLAQGLSTRGYCVITTRTRYDAAQIVARRRPDAVILDLAPFEHESLALCADLRATSSVPVLLCSTSPHRWVPLGMQLGADDFVSKPLSFDELDGRLSKLLGRTRRAASLRTIRVGDLVITPDRHRATLRGARLHLTATEFRLLVALAKHVDTTVSRDELKRSLSTRSVTNDGRGLDTHIRRLREKLQGSAIEIKTARGRGYRLSYSSERYRSDAAEAVVSGPPGG